ncbi:hypothetical protein [Litchfieldella anticariensis]|uniref:hypothetical protein n=1 Tax=Litchfieldella anticariensis TaxID=258591 RepID=UPI001F31114C|nr:hypothetical protein [Halomonas anticariensis]
MRTHIFIIIGLAILGAALFGVNGQPATYSSKRPVASRSRSYRFVSGNGGNQDSRRTIQLS